jgi:hypothetical protein
MTKTETITYASSAKPSLHSENISNNFPTFQQLPSKIKTILMHTSATRNFPAYKVKEF